MNRRIVVDSKIYIIIIIVAYSTIFSNSKVSAQSSCDDYFDILDYSVSQLFTTEMNRGNREQAFPSIVHDVSETEIRRLVLPSEQWICDGVLNAIYKDDPVKDPPTHYALYVVKDYYFMVIYKYLSDSDGTQYIQEPTVGGLFDPQFNRVGVIFM
ncbi:hypothetical protein DDZ15_06445 [Rhodohalobacter mucosus]|uniref:Uncharacterized protein n=1 Tax=Rhodohalobacter mucosus TaxID=2079485 RepID=A0A316TUA5_9BACT|nr:hypothetical protein DDZ15_06445 [Rhodohalobacter mucosus]